MPGLRTDLDGVFDQARRPVFGDPTAVIDRSTRAAVARVSC
jgi:hypothetical protein